MYVHSSGATAILVGWLFGAATGCCLSHDIGAADGGPEGTLDAPAEPRIDVPDVPDVQRDPIVPDTACAFGWVRPSLVCTRTGAAEGLLLSARVEDCFCGETFACDVRVEGSLIRLATRAESCGLLCDGCFPLEGSCILPFDLAPGAYRVDVNDAFAFDLTISRDGLLPYGTCWNPAPVVETGSCFFCENTATPVASVDSVCVPPTVSTSESFVVSATTCSSCFIEPAGCRITYTGGVVVEPLSRRCDCPCCGRCDPTCIPRTSRYWVPATGGPGTIRVEIGSHVRTVTAVDGPGENRACAAP